jgi:hypothetical protein
MKSGENGSGENGENNSNHVHRSKFGKEEKKEA